MEIKARINFKEWDSKSEYNSFGDEADYIKYQYEEDRNKTYSFRSIEEDLYMLQDDFNDVRDGAIFKKEEIIII